MATFLAATCTATWLGACAAEHSALRERTFAAGEHTRVWAGTSLELLEVDYGPQVVQVRVHLRNLGDSPVQVRRDGILLAYDGLEYPLNPTAAGKLHAVMALDPHADAQLELAFRLARPMTRDGQLLLRGMTRDAKVVPPLALPVPPALEDTSTSPGDSA